LKTAEIEFTGVIGTCGGREVFLAFGSARVLASVSFPDVLSEATGRGYQRRFHRSHSLEFKKYIHTEGASTIPLTFNLRPDRSSDWQIERVKGTNSAVLRIASDSSQAMAQVDCQHRLGYLRESNISLAFMTFIGLTVAEEMEVFRVINGKAKGLSGSLLDLTEAKLSAADLEAHKPQLYLALRLHEDERSPWHGQLDLGGTQTVGNMRRASLRTMQKAAQRFIKSVGGTQRSTERDARILIDFWSAITMVLPKQWQLPRRHLITKGIGVYALMSMAGQLTREAEAKGNIPDLDYFIMKLSDFVDEIDWSIDGPMKGYGGTSGADAAYAMLRQIRAMSQQAPHIYGKQEHTVN
jgi:DNA sulfur modification protein DndB